MVTNGCQRVAALAELEKAEAEGLVLSLGGGIRAQRKSLERDPVVETREGQDIRV